MPGDFEFSVWMGFLVCGNRFFEAAFADETPGADLPC
jgi:hypothetical protein